MRYVLTILLALVVSITMIGCTSTTAAVSGAVGSSASMAGSKLLTMEAWAQEQIKAAQIQADARKRIRAIEMDTDADIKAMELTATARDTAAAEAEAKLRQYRLAIGSDELGHSVKTVADSERLYMEEKARRERLEIENARLRKERDQP